MAMTMASFIGMLMVVVVVRNHIYNIMARCDLIILKHSVRFGLKAYIDNLLQFFNYRFDVFVVNYFLGASNVGFYTIAVSLGEIIWFIPNAVAGVLFPRTASSTPEAANCFTPIVFRHTFLLTTFSAVFLFIISRTTILLFFGEQFISSLLPLWILLPGIIMLSLSKILMGDLNGRGLAQYGSYSSGISLIITLTLDILLIPRIGIVGAALASTVAYATKMVIVIYLFLRESRLSLNSLFCINLNEFQVYRDYIQEYNRCIQKEVKDL
jgi:O-antigen/teichoic acid export membrane protein